MPKDDDKVEEAGAQYQSSETPEASKEEEKDVIPKEGDLPVIPMPPQGLIKAAFWTRLSYKAQASAIAAYNESYRAVADTVRAKKEFNVEVLAFDRSIENLKDASKIHEADAKARTQNLTVAKRALMEAEDDLEEAEHQRYLRKQQRLIEKAQADRRYNAFLNTETPNAVTNLSDDEQEFVKAFESEVGGPQRMRAAMERIIENFVKSKDGKLSPEDEAQVAAMNAVMEQRIRDVS